MSSISLFLSSTVTMALRRLCCDERDLDRFRRSQVQGPSQSPFWGKLQGLGVQPWHLTNSMRHLWEPVLQASQPPPSCPFLVKFPHLTPLEASSSTQLWRVGQREALG
jgi:hypothetical protein